MFFSREIPIGKWGSPYEGGETVFCPHRPGKPKISKGACRNRYLHSRNNIYFE
jgi:hypothetical protein